MNRSWVGPVAARAAGLRGVARTYPVMLVRPRMMMAASNRAEGNDAFTKILLHMDGSNGSTTFTDVCAGATPHTFTASGNAQISTAQSKFGGAAGLFDGTGDCIRTPDSNDFTLGSGAWTYDLWFNRAGGDGTRRFLFGTASSGGAGGYTVSMELTAGNVLRAIVSTDGATANVDFSGTTTFTSSGWHHAALVRTGNTIKMFVDGTQEGGDKAYSSTVNNSINQFGVGSFGEFTSNMWNGYIDEFRLSVGIARWTANFTPPTRAYG